MKCLFPTVFICLAASLFASNESRGDVVVRVSEIEGNVVVQYGGTLDLTGLTFTIGNTTTDSSSLTTYSTGDAIINAFATDDGGTFFDDPFASVPTGDWLSVGGPADVTFQSNHFVVLPAGDFENPLRLHTADIEAGVWSGTGGFRFNGTTIADLGLDLSQDRIWTLNNGASNTIRLTAIPEPAMAVGLLGLTTAMTFRRSRRRVARLS
ncbi:MAG: hypothetical protein AAGJ83_10745 [Planctomycetota bacterium]